MKYCRNCGASVEMPTTFCSNCGKLLATTGNSSLIINKRKSSKKTIIIGSIAASILMFVGICLGMGNFDNLDCATIFGGAPPYFRPYLAGVVESEGNKALISICLIFSAVVAEIVTLFLFCSAKHAENISQAITRTPEYIPNVSAAVLSKTNKKTPANTASSTSSVEIISTNENKRYSCPNCGCALFFGQSVCACSYHINWGKFNGQNGTENENDIM